MNLNWDSLLEPIFLFILSLIAGTLWVIVPTTANHPKAAGHATPPAIIAPAAPVLAAAKTRPAEEQPFARALAGTQKQVSASTGALQAAEEQVRMTDDELRQLQQENRELAATLESERQSLESLGGQLRSLQQPGGVPGQPAPLARQNTEIAGETEALRKLLAQKETETGRLQTQLSATKSLSDGEIPYVPKAEAPDKLPVPVDLIHNRVIAVNKEGFKIQAKLAGPVTATRKSEGETIAQIRERGSAFAKMLDKMKPEKEYLAILLNADSFEMFREVRRIARKRGIDIGWEPADTSSGQIEMFRVRLSQKVDKQKNGPRITSILH